MPPLAALVKAGYEVTAVVTQPDKPKGRGKTLMPTPVKEEAMKHEIPVYQPAKVRDPEFVETLTGLAPDYHRCGSFWTDHPEDNPGSSEIWMYQHPCFPASEIQRCSTDPAGSH